MTEKEIATICNRTMQRNKSLRRQKALRAGIRILLMVLAGIMAAGVIVPVVELAPEKSLLFVELILIWVVVAWVGIRLERRDKDEIYRHREDSKGQ